MKLALLSGIPDAGPEYDARRIPWIDIPALHITEKELLPTAFPVFQVIIAVRHTEAILADSPATAGAHIENTGLKSGGMFVHIVTSFTLREKTVKNEGAVAQIKF